MDFFLGLLVLVAVGFFFFLLALPFILRHLFVNLAALRARLQALEQHLHDHGAEGPARQAPEAEIGPEFEPGVTPATPETASEAGREPSAAAAIPPSPRGGDSWTPPDMAGWGAARDTAASGPSLFSLIKTWALGGNTLARVGVLVLFFGVAFLLKFAMEQGMIPTEFRLAGAALGGIVLSALGWRLRAKRRSYALALQGGGSGIVYLTVFAAVNMYQLVPPLPGLILMVALVAMSGALAVLQDARSLAVLGAVGGFLAPVLVSQGGGSHVTLFSFYLVLDLGILGIAWFKAWRELNLLGFGFTFVLGAIWGAQYYQPAHFASTEPFLIAFFLLYAVLPVLFALRQPPQLRGYVDGSLVFGVPLVASALQAALVADIEYGLAFSALAVGIFYAALAMLLGRRRHPNLRMLIEAFLALAVAFGTLAIPFAVDGRMTGGAWALEGAALVWIGVRQERWLARGAGLLIQLAAGAAFLLALEAPKADWPVLNSVYIGAVLVSLAGLFSAYYLFRHRALLSAAEREASTSASALGWGLVWWSGAGLAEIAAHVGAADRIFAVLVFLAGSAAALLWLRRRVDWGMLIHPLMLFGPLAALLALVLFSGPGEHPPFARWGLLAWGLAVVVFYRLLRDIEPEWPAGMARMQHLGGLWLLIFLLAWEAAWLLGRAVPEATVWAYAAWGLVPAACIAALSAYGERLAWPVRRFRDLYFGPGLAGPAVFLVLWSLAASVQAGGAAPLPYVPVLNPLELVQLFVLLVLLRWSAHAPLPGLAELRWYAWAAVAFVALNGIIARAVHFWAEVPFTVPALWHSEQYQAAVSITWTLAALLITALAARVRERQAWLAGAVLIGGVVLKLFLVDLAGVGTLARIVSFLVVGVLILVIAYLSPLPPRAARSEA